MKKKLKKLEDQKDSKKKKETPPTLKFLIRDPTPIKYKFVINSSFNWNYFIKRFYYIFKKDNF
ncbi:MAG: hypothetical protein QXF48_01295 [Candidatus Anstonellaceae archaeon]